MTGLLSNAGRAALREFGAAVIVLAPGILYAANLNDSRLLATSAVIAGLVAAIKAVQVFVPFLTTGIPALDALLRAGLASFFTLTLGVLQAPDLTEAKSALTAVGIGVAAALLRVAQGLLTAGENPVGQPAHSTPLAEAGFHTPDRAV